MANRASRRMRLYSSLTRERPSTWEPEREWLDLANAIVLQAVEDYRRDRKQIARLTAQLEDPSLTERQRWAAQNKLDEARWDMEEIEDFFGGNYIQTLTKLDGKAILEKLKEEPIGTVKRRRAG